jgi:hypothetical protein
MQDATGRNRKYQGTIFQTARRLQKILHFLCHTLTGNSTSKIFLPL